MPRRAKSNLVSNVFQASIRAGFRRAYNGVQVDPHKYLQQFRRANRMPIHTWSSRGAGGEVCDARSGV
jgi:hypothetical protein